METFMERSNTFRALRDQLTAETLTMHPAYETIPVAIRPIRPDDAVLLHQMHGRLSSDSIYYRYLRPYRPQLADMERLCHLQRGEGAAFVATVDGPHEAIIGVAYYLVAPAQPETAEPAILVEDDFQGQGVGHRLWQRLIRHASDQGILYFDALVHPGNSRVFRLLRRGGQVVESQMSYGMREVRISL